MFTKTKFAIEINIPINANTIKEIISIVEKEKIKIIVPAENRQIVSIFLSSNFLFKKLVISTPTIIPTGKKTYSNALANTHIFNRASIHRLNKTKKGVKLKNKIRMRGIVSHKSLL